jgi:hypothetical protein
MQGRVLSEKGERAGKKQGRGCSLESRAGGGIFRVCVLRAGCA